MLIDGIHVPLAEPFYRDGALYLRKLEHNVRRYSLSPVSGLVALPPSGEASSLSDQESIEVLQTVGQTAGREKVLVAGISRDSVRAAIALAEAADAANFDALLVSVPRTWRNLQANYDSSALVLFFRAVADAVALPVFLWSDSTDGGFELPPGMITGLSGHPNILGIYDANLTAERRAAITQGTEAVRRDVEVTTVFAPVTRRMKKQESTGAATFVSAIDLGGGAAVAVAPLTPALKTRTKNVGFQIMSAGSTGGMVSLLEAGIAGAMPHLATCAPQACFEAYAAFKDGDGALAIEKATRLQQADQLLATSGIAATKYACDLNGYYGGLPRLPRLPLKAEDRERVEAALRELRS